MTVDTQLAYIEALEDIIAIPDSRIGRTVDEIELARAIAKRALDWELTKAETADIAAYMLERCVTDWGV